MSWEIHRRLGTGGAEGPSLLSVSPVGRGGRSPCWKLLQARSSECSDIIFFTISVYQSKNKPYRAFQMQEARSTAYFTRYTNLFGSLSHQTLARESWSLSLMRLQMMLHWSLLKFTTCITRTLTWGSLKTPCASKVTRVRTLANMLAAAPLASSMFSEVDKLVRIYISQSLLPLQLAKGPFLPSDASNPTWDVPCPSSASTT